MNEGFIKIHRKIFDNPLVCKDADHLAIWIYLLCHATHKEMDVMFKGKRTTLKAGQLLTGCISIGNQLNINYVKVHRVINEFKIEKQIEKQSSNKNTLITILNWDKYQYNEKQNEIPMKNNCKTSENKQECKNDKNERIIKESIKEKRFQKPTLEEVKEYCKERNNNVDAERFINYYESNGWKVGRNSMKDWKASIRTWEKGNTSPKQLESKPEWFGKEIEEEDDLEKQKRMEEMLSGFK